MTFTSSCRIRGTPRAGYTIQRSYDFYMQLKRKNGDNYEFIINRPNIIPAFEADRRRRSDSDKVGLGGGKVFAESKSGDLTSTVGAL